MKVAKAKLERLKALQHLVAGTTRLSFDFHVAGRDGAQLDIGPDRVVLHSWMESGHNGNSYDSTMRTLNDEETNEAIDEITRRLEERAIKNLIEGQEEEAKRARERKARSDLEIILKNRAKAKKCKGCEGILSWTPSGHCCLNTNCREFRDDGTTC